MNRKLLSILPLVIFIGLQGQQSGNRGFIVSVGDPSPNYSLKLINGRKHSKKSLLGKVVVLQFTASWCSVCRREMPHLEKEVWQRFRHEDFILIGVDRDEPRKIVRKFAREMKITYPMALDLDANIFGLFALKDSGVTRNIVMDKKGNIRFLTRLFNPMEFQEMIEVIDTLLKESS